MGVKAVILRSQKQWPVRSSTVGMISSPRFIDDPTWRRSGTSVKRGRLVGSVAGMILGRRFGDDLRHNPQSAWPLQQPILLFRCVLNNLPHHQVLKHPSVLVYELAA